MKILLVFLSLFIFEARSQHHYPRVYPARCEGFDLISNFHQVIYQFSFASECRKGLDLSFKHEGYFCDDSKLLRPTGYFLHQFSWGNDCLKALEEMTSSKYGLFCDGSVLLQKNYGIILDHGFKNDCQESLVNANEYNGLFCHDGVMYDFRGVLLRNYSFQQDCLRALKEITF